MCEKTWEQLDFDGFIAKFNEICNYQSNNQQFAYEYKNYIAYMDLKTKIGDDIVRVSSFTTEVRNSEEQESLKKNIENKLKKLKNDAETESTSTSRGGESASSQQQGQTPAWSNSAGKLVS